VQSAIHTEWASLGWERSALGYPVTDENVTPDGIGRYNHFQSGSIYWTPNTGAHEVHGLIREKWAALGWERSALGYPISDETDEVDGSGRFNVFEHGTIHWNRGSNAITVKDNSGMLMTPMVINVNRAGGDIAHLNLPSDNPAMCQQQCADNVACQAWTLVKPGVQGTEAVCWLKNSTPLQDADNNCISGLKIDMHPVGMSPMAGREDRVGGDFADFNLPTSDPLLCQGECAHNASCKSWAYREVFPQPNNQPSLPQHCWLKNTVPPTSANGLVISGSR
jgi:hypothetical protein